VKYTSTDKIGLDQIGREGTPLTDIKLRAANRLRLMQRHHFRSQQIVPTRQSGGEFKFVCHVVLSHEKARPRAIDVIQLVDLEPSSAGARRRGRIVHSEEEMGDWASVYDWGPLHFDRVALVGGDGLDGGLGCGGDVAGHVWAGDVGYRAVIGGQADSGLDAGGLVVDPELAEVLVRGGRREEGAGEEEFGEHGGFWYGDWIGGV
jgi:hypothetical protein